MTTTINASNSGSGGLVQTADASGILALQTAGTTAITIDASQNVGIGTSSPGGKLEVNQGKLVIKTTDQSLSRLQIANTGVGGQTFEVVGGDVGVSNSGLSFYDVTNSATRMRIDSSGNLLVGTTTQATGALLTVNGSIKGTITSGTAVASTSGTSIDFTGIPSWVKRITVMFSGVSTNGSSLVQVQLGYSGGIVSSGYLGAVVRSGTGTNGSNFSSGFTLTDSGTGGAASHIKHGIFIFSLLNASTNNWAMFGNIAHSDTANTWMSGGSVPLSGVLTTVRITTVNGTDTFDAGSINILYEG